MDLAAARIFQAYRLGVPSQSSEAMPEGQRNAGQHRRLMSRFIRDTMSLTSLRQLRQAIRERGL
jgi:hypothetical protein